MTSRVCLKLFTRNSDVKAHILRVHCGDRRYPCTMCGKRFLQFCAKNCLIFLKHANIFAEIDAKSPIIPDLSIWACCIHQSFHKKYFSFFAECRYTPAIDITHHFRFKESTHLRKHLYTHTGERPHYCALCSKGVNSSKKNTNLKRWIYHSICSFSYRIPNQFWPEKAQENAGSSGSKSNPVINKTCVHVMNKLIYLGTTPTISHVRSAWNKVAPRQERAGESTSAPTSTLTR